jgi:predicted nucleotidyltransferase
MAGLETIAGLSAREHLVIASSRGRYMQAVPDKLAALRDVVAALGSLGAAHAIIGGVAVGIRSGVPRATLDTDIAVRSTVPRDRIIEALVGAGFLHRGSHSHSLNFEHASGEPVQLAIDHTFDPMVDRAELMDLGGIGVRVVTTDDLIAMKERAAADPGRRRSKALRDQADIALLRGDIPHPDEGW